MDILERIKSFVGDWSEPELIHDAMVDAAEEITKLRAEVKERTDFEIALKDDNERLRAENEALRKDAERWLFITLVDCFCLDDTDCHDWGDRVDEMIRNNREKFDQALTKKEAN